MNKQTKNAIKICKIKITKKRDRKANTIVKETKQTYKMHRKLHFNRNRPDHLRISSMHVSETSGSKCTQRTHPWELHALFRYSANNEIRKRATANVM